MRRAGAGPFERETSVGLSAVVPSHLDEIDFPEKIDANVGATTSQPWQSG
jgi:hypothetical protein